MKLLLPLFLATLLLEADDAIAQPAPDELLAVGPAGMVVLIHIPNDNALEPIVLLNDEVLNPGSVDCALAPGHPQCRALDYLLGAEMVGPGGAPLIVAVDTAGGVTLYSDAGPSTYPPPAVVVDGVWVNSPYANNVQVVGSHGEIVIFEAGDVDSPAPFVSLNGQVLTAGGVDCELVLGLWVCNLPNGGQVGVDPGSGPVGVYAGSEGNVFVDFSVSDSPPPAVYKDGEILNR